MIKQESIQQVQSRIDIIDIIGSFVKLKRRGANYLGNCPFHHEKTPSFTVSPTKEIYKCFGCGKSGNTISFLMEHEKYSYVEAIRWLAERYQIELEETETSPEFKAIQLTSDSLYIINHFARDFFRRSLLQTDEGRDIALSYLHERGFSDDIIEKFQLGFNPSARDEFAGEAIRQQFNKDLLVKTGLVVSRDEKLQDNYRGRIIFPIHNQSGKVMGFGARVIKSNDKAPKYINTPENEIYVKSRILYGSYFARTAIDKADECLLVEGYTDVISLHQAGIENVVASGGTSLTIEQLRLIRKYTRNLTIIYDGDNAGVKAALRGLDLALEEGLNVKLVLIPDKEDPDSYVKKIGASAFNEFVKSQKKDFILFQLEIALMDAGNDMQRKSAIVNQIADTISRINKTEDFTKRQDYVKRVSEMLKIEEAGFNALVNKIIRDRITKDELRSQNANIPIPEIPESETTEVTVFINTDEQHETAMVRSLIEFGTREWEPGKSVADHIFGVLDELDLHEMIDNLVLTEMMSLYRKWHQEGLQPTDKNFLYHDNPAISSAIIKVMEVETEISPNWKEHYKGHIPTREELYREEVISTLNYLQLRKIKKLMKENLEAMESTSDPEQQLLLLKTHQLLKKMETDITSQSGMVIYK